MGTIVNDARDKLERECAGKFDKYGEAMKGAVKRALTELCRQDEGFAEKVAEGGSFEECMKAVAKKIKGGAISDLEAFRAAVKYFEPEADIEFRMILVTPKTVRETIPAQEAPAEKEGKIFDLLDFL